MYSGTKSFLTGIQFHADFFTTLLSISSYHNRPSALDDQTRLNANM